ncbi:MAG: hypothetical protein ACOYKZ_07575 [Chlamydiia bacterium]
MQIFVLFFLALLLLFGLFSEPSTPLDPATWILADARSWNGIPYIATLAADGCIIVAGLFGLFATVRAGRRAPGFLDGAQLQWVFVFGAAILGGVGGMLLRLSPSFMTLGVVRTATVVGLTALLNTLIIERVRHRYGIRIAPWLLVLALISVLVWFFKEDAVTGSDSRLYTAMVIYPLIVLPLIMNIFPLPTGGGSWLLTGWAIYLVGKFLEILDLPIFTWTNTSISGHTLGILCTAAAVACAGVSLLKRRQVTI